MRDGKVFVAIRVDPARAKAMAPMQAAVEAAIKALPGVASVLVTLTAENAPGAAEPRRRDRARRRRAAAGRSRASRRSSPSPRARAASASRPPPAISRSGLPTLGLKVGVLDADMFGPSMPRLFGITEKPALAPDGQKLLPIEKYGVKVMSIGFLVEDNSAIVWRGPMVASALNQFLRDVEWGELDVLVVDMPPGTGDVQLTIAQNAPLAGAVIVSTPQDLSLIDARRADRHVQAGRDADPRHRREHELSSCARIAAGAATCSRMAARATRRRRRACRSSARRRCTC